MNEPKLKPCPFCGTDAEYDSQSLRNKIGGRSIMWTVSCPKDDCFCSLTFDRDDQMNFLFETKEEAADAWNKRAEQ